MTVLLLLLAWLLGAPLLAVLVGSVCRSGQDEDGPVDWSQWPDCWPEWPDDDPLAGGPGAPWSTASP